MRKVTHISRSPEETAALGRAYASQARAGWIIGLKGDLGAGKTQFARGFAAGLGSPGRVHSPTFALVNELRGGRLPLFHIDLYRLESGGAVHGAGLDEYFNQRDGVTLVEWFERLEAVGMGNTANCVLNFEVAGDEERRIVEERNE